MVSQEVLAVFGGHGFGHVIYYLVQLATMLILFTGGNTSFNGFPYLTNFVANDRFLPRQLTKRGHRLAFSNGIVVLGSMALVLVLVFQARVNSLIALYAIGVFTGFTLAGAGMERLATEVRHLQRTEVREVQEPFRSGQKGSSAMPHKRNPIKAEQIAGLARVLRGNAQAALENVALWHERDISHSSVERVILPDSTILLDYLQHRTTALVEGMTVDVERMRENLELTHGALFSQRVLLAIVSSGLSREHSYRIVQELAQRAWDEGIPLRELLSADERVRELGLDLDAIFDYGHYVRHAAEIVGRLDEALAQSELGA